MTKQPQADPQDDSPDVSRDQRYAEWMGLAIEEARASLETADVPVGAVVLTPEGEVLGRGRNRRVADGDPLAHAEMLSIRSAAGARGHYRLDDAIMCVTLEPCLMCAGAIMQSRIGLIVFGAWDPKAGACGSAWDVTGDNPSPLHTVAVGGVRRDECAGLLTDFFRQRRGRTPAGDRKPAADMKTGPRE